MNFRKKFWPFDASSTYNEFIVLTCFASLQIADELMIYIYILVNNKSSSSFALGLARVCKMMIITFLLPILLGPHLILYNFKRLRKTRCWESGSTWFFSNFLQGWRTRCRMQFFLVSTTNIMVFGFTRSTFVLFLLWNVITYFASCT
jgi:hypothetical protein